MARIRTIKPEFPQSESMGRVSREARLLFVLLWTIADDEGRSRANSRMLASLLYPYDDDAGSLLPGWMDELEREGCVRRYEFQGSAYLEIVKWREHQKIDKPSGSKLPKFEDGTRIVPQSLECSRGLATTSRSVVVGPGPGPGPGPGRDQEGTLVKSADADPPPDDFWLAVEAYNSEASRHGWPKAQRITAARTKALRGRLRDCGGLDGWREAMRKAGASAFLSGTARRQGDHANWKPDLDFFLQQSSFTRLMEGKYDGSDSGPGSFDDAFERLASGAREAAE